MDFFVWNKEHRHKQCLPGLGACSNYSFQIQGIGKTSLLNLFGMNARGVPRVDLHHPLLPFFLCASLKPGDEVGQQSQVQENCQKVLACLDVESTRNSCICFDDTVYFPTYSILYLPEATIVGGVEESSLLKLDGQNIESLPKSGLAQTAISYIVSRADSNRHCYDVLMQPRRLKHMTGENSLETAGKVWQACTDANGGVPPLAQSCDNHASQICHNYMFLGMSTEQMGSLPFLCFANYALYCLEFVWNCRASN